MPNLENFLAFEHWQYDFVRHMFTLSVAVFAAGLVYFALSLKNTAPWYRISSILSAVVMVSAALELYQLFRSWEEAFVAVPLTGAAGAASTGLLSTIGETSPNAWLPVTDAEFSNGYRYINWSIDVPMLLTQLLVVVGLTGAAFWSNWWKLTLAGLVMVYTGYIGQYFEPAAAGLAVAEGRNAYPFWVWGFVSTIPFIYINYKVMVLTHRVVGDVPDRVRKEMGRIGVFLVATWTLYTLGYVLPAIWPNADGMVFRQAVYTVADITSKLVFGVMLSRVALIRSAYDGFEPAILARQGLVFGRPDVDVRPIQGTEQPASTMRERADV
ncbi:bacteriorhodopsin [Parvularcula dongshanensis]|uniref:Bacteriorhodopsin n=1 Tax=Parvularcula dongshanensis TaxID=1173995 RepID=A0A840I3S2_9PROT|nr:bacteriorhodopsin [Parvularcula dongshanensis]MBB4658690.1 bacteriorhodopsin [Parvularcula dongshanensis]